MSEQMYPIVIQNEDNGSFYVMGFFSTKDPDDLYCQPDCNEEGWAGGILVSDLRNGVGPYDPESDERFPL